MSVDTFISGMAIGVDLLAAECVIEVRKSANIKLIGAVPFPSQAGKWPKPSQDHWAQTGKACDTIHYVSADPYHPSKMQIRNEWMVDHSNYVIAVWDGTKNGGTWNCIKYALAKSKPVLHVKWKDLGYSGFWLQQEIV